MSKFDIWILRGLLPILIAILGYFANQESSIRAEITDVREEISNVRVEFTDKFEALSKEFSNTRLILTKDGAQAQLALFEEIIKNRAKIDVIESESKLRDGEVYKEVLEYLINAKVTLKE